MSDPFEESALRYHREPTPGKLSITPTKPLANQFDLAQAYSPGVAHPCLRIRDNPADAALYTSRGNLVAVISNGTAVLGLGNIGPLAAKPVMEGKAVLFKKFAGIDVFDIEIAEEDPDLLVEVIARLEPTFGAINLEDIKSPECFEVERKLRERLKIPVFHDDQHGTAIVASAAIKNGLRVVGKSIDKVRLVTSGAGAASLACIDLLVDLGLRKENVLLVDRKGVVYAGRKEDMNEYKMRYAAKTRLRTLSEAIEGADIFLGLSGPGVLTGEMAAKMAEKPMILALANPTPEILPEIAKKARPDALIATGRSDYPNQVNNVLCFPFIFRGALDVGATTINAAMKIACVEAIANLAMRESTDEVANAYQNESLKFGADYLIPKPFDKRLMAEVSFAVAKAAMESGVATRPIKDLEKYRLSLASFGLRSSMFMQPMLEVAKRSPERLVYAEGENPIVLRAVQTVCDEGIAYPIVIGRAEVVAMRIADLGLRVKPGVDFELTDPQNDRRYREYWQFYHQRVSRRGVSVSAARDVIRTNTTAIAACMVAKGEAEAMICGSVGRFDSHLPHIIDIIGSTSPETRVSSMAVLILPSGPLFIADAYIGIDPPAAQVAATTLACAERISGFGIKPKVALLSHSNFGSSRAASARKMRAALKLLKAMAPDLEVDGEMHASAAMNQGIRDSLVPDSVLTGSANLLIMPDLDTANISMELVRAVNDALLIGPVLSGTAKPAHIVTPWLTMRGIFNMSAIAIADVWRMKHSGAQRVIKV